MKFFRSTPRFPMRSLPCALCLSAVALATAASAPAQSLTLEVNTPTGRILLINDSGSPIDFDFYEIASTDASLNIAGWASLEDQGIGDNGIPDDGIGWEELGTPDAMLLAEGFLFGSTVLQDGDRFNLGDAFIPAATEDLDFTYQTPAGDEFAGLVTYDPTILGDMDGNGTLDAFDVDDFELALADPAAYALAHPTLDPNTLGDITGDGILDAFDVTGFEALLAGGAAMTETQTESLNTIMAVPEPAAGTILGLLALAALRRCR